MELSGREGVCPCTCLAVCVLQHVPLYTVHMYCIYVRHKYAMLYILVDVYESVITYVGTSLYARITEGVCCRGFIRYLETQNGSSEGGVMNK